VTEVERLNNVVPVATMKGRTVCIGCGTMPGSQPSVWTGVFRCPAPPSRPDEHFVCPRASRAEARISRACSGRLKGPGGCCR